MKVRRMALIVLTNVHLTDYLKAYEIIRGITVRADYDEIFWNCYEEEPPHISIRFKNLRNPEGVLEFAKNFGDARFQDYEEEEFIVVVSEKISKFVLDNWNLLKLPSIDVIKYLIHQLLDNCGLNYRDEMGFHLKEYNRVREKIKHLEGELRDV